MVDMNARPFAPKEPKPLRHYIIDASIGDDVGSCALQSAVVHVSTSGSAPDICAAHGTLLDCRPVLLQCEKHVHSGPGDGDHSLDGWRLGRIRIHPADCTPGGSFAHSGLCGLSAALIQAEDQCQHALSRRREMGKMVLERRSGKKA